MSVRIHVILPETLVAEIDELVGPRRRSEFIAETLEAAVRRERFRDALARTAGRLDLSDYPEWSTPRKPPTGFAAPASWTMRCSIRSLVTGPESARDPLPARFQHRDRRPRRR